MQVTMNGRNALITGGSLGIGRAIATRFVESGGNVAIVARRQAVLDEAKDEIQKAGGGKVVAIAADVGTAGLICREHCFANGLIMRHVGDRMVISPPLVISKPEIDTLVERANIALDLTHKQLKDEGLMKAAS